MPDRNCEHYQWMWDDMMRVPTGQAECMIQTDYNEYGFEDGHKVCLYDHHESCPIWQKAHSKQEKPC